MKIIGNSWDEYLGSEFAKPYYQQLRKFLDVEYEKHTIYPPARLLYSALRLCSYEQVKVVILGQDPYHQPQQAMGLAFSVPPGIAVPPSLQNIYKEIYHEYGYPLPHTGDLRPWAKQGVLLLNTVLSVRENTPFSHRNQGWEQLTDAIIRLLDRKESPLVFLLWGQSAKTKMALLQNPDHLALYCAHPSPLSAYRGFFGCNHFRECNRFLREHGQKEINWQIKDV